MTNLNKNTIIRNRMIKKYTPLIAAALRSQIDEACAIIREKGPMAAQGNIHVGIINTKVADVIKAMYVDIARLAIRSYKVNKKGFPLGRSLPFIDKILKFFDKYLLDKIVIPISQTTIDQIENALDKGIKNGWGGEKIAHELQGSDIPMWRARLIVRTEATRGYNFAQIVRADDEYFEMQKTWMAIEDGRTRDSHSDHGGVDGETVGLYERFSNGLMFPGDPEGFAEEVCNCRCTLSYRVKRDEDGNPIEKANPGLDIMSHMTILQSNLADKFLGEK